MELVYLLEEFDYVVFWASEKMPTYEYVCDECDHKFEEFQSITAKPVRKCPKCGKNKVRRLIGSGGGLIFKGNGFYQTDYRSETYKEAAKAEKEKDTPSKSDKSKSTDASDKSKSTDASDKSKSTDAGGKKGKKNKAKESVWASAISHFLLCVAYTQSQNRAFWSQDR